MQPVDESTSPRRTSVFISYSRRDQSEADALTTALQEHGFEAYLDKSDILPGEAWQERLAALIANADTVLFLLSPDSLASRICDWEVNEADRLSKRVLPVVVRPVAEAEVPGRLRRINYVFLDRDLAEGDALSRLVQAIETDIGWIREHTRIGLLAARWVSGRRLDALLRGEELVEAEAWLASRPGNAPEATREQRDFLAAGRSQELRRQRRETIRTRMVAAGSLVAALVVSVAGWFFYQSSQEALRSQSLFLADLSRQQLKDGDPVAAQLIALEGIADPASPSLTQRLRPREAAAELAADTALRRWPSFPWLEQVPLVGHKSSVEALAFSLDGELLATASRDHTTSIWRLASRQLVVRVSHPNGVGFVAFAPDGKTFLTAPSPFTTDLFTQDQSPEDVAVHSARLWDTASGRLVASFEHGGDVTGASLSPDGSLVATTSDDRTVAVWKAAPGEAKLKLAHDEQIELARFLPGDSLLTVDARGKGRLWSTETGALRRTLDGIIHLPVAISATGDWIAGATESKAAGLWSAASGARLASFQVDDATVAVAFSRDDALLLTASKQGAVSVWERASGRLRGTLQGHESGPHAIAVSPDGKLLLTGSQDRTARIWDIDTMRLVQVLPGVEDSVMAVSFAPDGKTIAVAGADHTARLWIAQPGGPREVVTGFEDGVTAVDYTKDGRMMIWPGLPPTAELIGQVADAVPRCLTPKQRMLFHLGPLPPRWCFEKELWPYARKGAPYSLAIPGPFGAYPQSFDERLVSVWDTVVSSLKPRR